ncbi:hypothetical protein ACIBHX_46815 [Nonomuraea sp. NPDC050536]|uniref:hypothetical protein n=1 Tax=Nonomuraea sp. NPDC050536 TaxID=3364366 RepID=UPI0037C881B6
MTAPLDASYGTRRRRSDAGNVRQTPRDAVALEWLAHMYGAPLDVLGRLFGVGDKAAWAVANRWRRAGWANLAKMDAGPLWVWPTHATARQLLDLPSLGYWAPSASRTAHVRAVADVRAHLQGGLTLSGWRSERQLNGHGRRRQAGDKLPHLPDGLWWHQTLGRWVVIEVELTPKSRPRTEQILTQIMGDMHQRWQAEALLYLASPTAVPVLHAAITTLPARHQSTVRVLPLAELGTPAAAQTLGL